MRLRCARLPARPQALLRRGVVHGAAEGIAKRKFAWNVLPKQCMPQPENHRPRKVPPHAPLAMGSVDGATKMAAPSTQPPSERPSEQGRRGRYFSTCRLVANCRQRSPIPLLPLPIGLFLLISYLYFVM